MIRNERGMIRTTPARLPEVHRMHAADITAAIGEQVRVGEVDTGSGATSRDWLSDQGSNLKRVKPRSLGMRADGGSRYESCEECCDL